MLARQEKLLGLLGSENLRFKIPVFQRSYTWTADQCDELWRDMLIAADAGRDHFAGTVLCLPELRGSEACANGDAPGRIGGGAPGQLVSGAPGQPAHSVPGQSASVRAANANLVVDGQQRLVTLTLALIALREKLAGTGGIVSGLDGGSDLDAERIQDVFIGTAQDSHLTLNDVDNPTKTALATRSALPENPAQNVTKNFAFFQEQLAEPDVDLARVWRGLNTLTCIYVELDPDDLAQDIFESFNSKGVQLTTADLCRNFLLAPLSTAEQTHVYEDFWEPIEDLFGDDPGSLKLNNAILGWLTVRFRRIRAKGDKQAFRVFKRYMQEEFSGTVEQLMGELYNFCTVWAENYRYHPVKNYKSASNWATLGPKTLVSHIPIKPASPEAIEFYAKHFGVVVKSEANHEN